MHESRIIRRIAFAARWGRRYVRQFVITPALRPFSLGRRLWRLGWAERAVLPLAAAMALLTALATSAVMPAPRAAALLGAAHLGWFVLAWSVALAAAAAQRGPLALMVAGLWLIWYQVLACSALVPTPFLVVPVAWLGLLLFLHAQALPSWPSRIGWWFVASAGLGYVSAGPSGLRRALGWRPLDAQALLAAILLTGGVLAFLVVRRLRRDRPPAESPGFRLSFAGAFLAAGATVALAAARNWTDTVDWVHSVFDDASSIVILFWLCAAGQFAASLLRVTAWNLRRLLRFVPLTFLHAGWLEQVITWGVLAWLVPQALMVTARKVVESREAAAVVAGAGLLIVAVGLAFECGKLQRDWRHTTDERIRVELGYIVLVVACAVALSTMPGNAWETTRLLMVLAGMLHLGVPLAIHEHARRFGRESTDLHVVARYGLFAAGYVVALVALALDPHNVATLLAGLPFLLGGLVMLRRSSPGTGPWTGAVAGAIFCGGVVAGWMMPFPPTVPFLPVPPLSQVLRDWGTLGHVPLSPQHFVLLATAWIVGGGAGWVFFRTPRAPRPPAAPAAVAA